MRLFAAVLPPDEAIRELASTVHALERLPGAEGMRWTARPGWHFTLAFYGEVDEEAVPDLSERLARAARRTEPFRLSLHGGGRFGGRALWMGRRGTSPRWGCSPTVPSPRAGRRAWRRGSTAPTARI